MLNQVISLLVYFLCNNCNFNTVLGDSVKRNTELAKNITTQIVQNLQLQISNKVLGQPNIVLRVYSGSVSRLHCKIEPGQFDPDTVMWFYSSTYNISLNQIQEDETVLSKWNLTIYNTHFKHAGVYRCAKRGHNGGFVFLEVVDDEKYNVVKPLSSNGPFESKPVALNSQLIMFSAWSEWSECSRCELVGRKRRYGICYVNLIDKSKSYKNNQNASIDEDTFKLFHAFPDGIPCRSQMLPPSITTIHTIQTKKNEIMIGLCKVKCKESIFKHRSKSGNFIEIVNNTAGIYSLSQTKPPQPPLPSRRIMYVEPGKRFIIRCSGTTLRDMPFTWRIDAYQITPRDLDRKSNGRLHLNARDHIVFSSVLYNDAHVYSCWQDDILAGVVKLQIQRSAETTYRLRFALFTVIIILIMLLRLTMKLVRYRRRYLGIT